jgi:DNA repair protein RadC
METKPSTTHRIKDKPEEERPRERIARLGGSALNRTELLAILLRTGVPGENALELADHLLVEFGGLQGLHRAEFKDLSRVRGVGPAKAAQLKAALELGFRMNLEEKGEKPRIGSPEDVVALVQQPMSALAQEELWVMALDTRNRVLHTQHLYTGSLNHSTVRIAEIFEVAMRCKAAGVIVIHNHPSGDPSPSPEDIQLTRALREAGDLLDLKLLDHIIIGGIGFVSMKQKKLGFD